VLDEKRVAYLDLTGSGNETAAHLLHDGRITIMFCSFRFERRNRAHIRTRRRDSSRRRAMAGTDRAVPKISGVRQVMEISVESADDLMRLWSPANGPDGRDGWARYAGKILGDARRGKKRAVLAKAQCAEHRRPATGWMRQRPRLLNLNANSKLRSFSSLLSIASPPETKKKYAVHLIRLVGAAFSARRGRG